MNITTIKEDLGYFHDLIASLYPIVVKRGDVWPNILVDRVISLYDCDEDTASAALTQLAKDLNHETFSEESETEYSKSIQQEDDEEKEVADATNESSEQTHGGQEATKSVSDSQSSANDGEKDNTNNAEHSEVDQATEEDDNKKDKEVDRSEGEAVNSVAINPEALANAIINREECDDEMILTKCFKKLCTLVSGKAQGSTRKGWNKRAIVKHYFTSQLNRIPADKNRTGSCETITVAIDCSGSSMYYHKIVQESLLNMSRFYKIRIIDCSNGFISDGKSLLVDGDDVYNNRSRLEATFCKSARITMHPTITCPNVKDAVKIALASELFVVLADYDGYKTICQTAQLLDQTNKSKQLYFIDLESRYEDPAEHGWNCSAEKDYGTADWPESAYDHWWRIFKRDNEED